MLGGSLFTQENNETETPFVFARCKDRQKGNRRSPQTVKTGKGRITQLSIRVIEAYVRWWHCDRRLIQIL